jgi:hypothetical protein
MLKLRIPSRLFPPGFVVDAGVESRGAWAWGWLRSISVYEPSGK